MKYELLYPGDGEPLPMDVWGENFYLAGASSLAQAQTFVHGNLEHLRWRKGKSRGFLVAILVKIVVESREYYETTNF